MGRALITGASAGIGQEFATQLAQRGHDLILVARRKDRLVEIATALHRDYDVHVEVLPADLADRADVERVAGRLRDTKRPVDLLVNNAGFGTGSRIAKDLAEHERALDVMARAVLVLSSTFAATLRERASDQPRGGILNVSSVAGWAVIGQYGAIKAWVTSFTEALAVELAGTGILVTALCPGLVRTAFHDDPRVSLRGGPEFGWLEAPRVVGEALADLDRGRVISVPSRRYKVGVAVLRLLPRRVVRGAVARGVQRRRNHR